MKLRTLQIGHVTLYEGNNGRWVGGCYHERETPLMGDTHAWVRETVQRAQDAQTAEKLMGKPARSVLGRARLTLTRSNRSKKSH